ncbi:hypothetical protein C4577_02700 [Candidatus Parcubacteria bacterium]|nr:MAG: hypothetical protein C4577_02700 [Candidatus Parcubacteria bacterium]
MLFDNPTANSYKKQERSLGSVKASGLDGILFRNGDHLASSKRGVSRRDDDPDTPKSPGYGERLVTVYFKRKENGG